MLLEGLHIPLTTPFHRDGSLNTNALAANVLRYSLTPAAGLIVLGPAGEPTLLTDDETREALRAAAQAAAPEKVLIAGIARDSVQATLDLANFAAEQRYDAVLIGTPSILAPTQTLELLTFFRAIADRSPLPLILLSTAARPISTQTVAELATHRNILALLATHIIATADILARTAEIKREVTVTHVFAAVTGRMQRAAAGSLISPATLTTAVAEPASAQPPLRTRTKSIGFQIIAAHAPTLLDALNSGAVGIAPAFAAAAPQASYEILAAWKDQDQPLAAEKQQRLIEAADLTGSLGPGGLKFAADLNGYAGGFPRLPHLAPTGDQRAQLEQLMKPLHN
jgi:dihydrodipicolinate synthase/N-acetylneuraminate lyase